MNVIIITDVPPENRYTAGTVLYKLISQLGNDFFNLVWINQSSLPPPQDLPDNCCLLSQHSFYTSNFLRLMQRTWDWLGSNFITKPISYFFRALTQFVLLVPIAVKIIIQVKMRKPEIVWIVLQGDKLALIYSIVTFFCKRSTVFIMHQWDPVSWWLYANNRPDWYIGLMKYLVNNLESRADLNVVPSQPWAKKLQLEGKHATNIDNFFLDNQFEYTYLRYVYPKCLGAVFIGQLYANNELKSIIQILERFQNISEIDITLHYFGGASEVNFGNIRTIHHGNLNPIDLTKEISIYDFALLPYPTAIKLRETAELSFPSKSRQYLLAGLPILSYAPQYSSAHTFLHHSLDKESYFNASLDGDPLEFLMHLAQLSFSDRKKINTKIVNLARSKFSISAEFQPFEKLIHNLIDHERN